MLNTSFIKTKHVLHYLFFRSIFKDLNVLVLCIFGLYLRVPDRFLIPQFWAEDGTVLFVDAVNEGWKSLFEPYQGALYSYQRIASLIAVQFSWEYVPAIFMLFALASFSITALWCLSSRMPFERPVKIVMALWISYAPIKNEIYLNLINAHWIFCGLGLLLLIMSCPPKDIKQSLFDYGMCFLMGLTGPFCLIYFPLFLLKAYLQRDRQNYIILGIISACVVIQAFQLSTRDYQLMGGVLNPSIEQFLSVINFNFIWKFLGYETLQFRTLGILTSLIIFSLIVALFAFIFIELIKEKSHFQAYLTSVPLVACLLVLFATIVQYREMPEALINGARYWFIPTITFLWSLTLGAKSRPRVFIPLIIVPAIVFLSHPQWEEYKMPDLGWKESVECLQKNPNCVVLIHPLYFNFEIRSNDIRI